MKGQQGVDSRPFLSHLPSHVKIFFATVGKTNAVPLYPVFFFLILLMLLFPIAISAQDFTIDNFHSGIIINEDASFIVREAIDVRFHTTKHGIFREIPYKYSDERGGTIKTPLKVLSVTDDSGRPWKYKTMKKGNVVNIRIGDPDNYVSGIQKYVITYKVENAILFFDDHDELYWNVTGNYWWAPIKQVSSNVRLALKNQSRTLWAACYTGALGVKESACRYETSGNMADFFTEKDLSPREGFTIAFGWDKGLVAPPSSWRKFLWAVDIRENWVFVMPFFAMSIMMGLWRRRGRDPQVREAVAVRYEPPKYNNIHLTPGEVGVLVDERLDSRDITSTIIGLAEKGYISIEETKSEGIIFDSADFYLSRVKGPDDNLSPFETLLMTRIFTGDIQGRMVSDLKNKFYSELGLLRKTLYGEVVSKKYFLISPEKVRNVYMAAGIFTIVVSGILFALLLSSGKGVVAGVLTGLPVVAFSRFMPVKTRAGASVYMDILGFQEFMKRAEKDRLERMGDKNLFSRFLPYAIALDVVDSWAKAFEGVYQEQPGWYVSNAGFGRTFSPNNFSRSINSATSTLASAMYSAPRGSGVSSGGFSRGGGSSGGGFGGGGGGSW
jgi:hypothetical protein